MIVVVHEGSTLQEQLDDMRVSPTSGHHEDTRTQSVPSINICTVLQEDVCNSQVTKPCGRQRCK